MGDTWAETRCEGASASRARARVHRNARRTRPWQAALLLARVGALLFPYLNRFAALEDALDLALVWVT